MSANIQEPDFGLCPFCGAKLEYRGSIQPHLFCIKCLVRIEWPKQLAHRPEELAGLSSRRFDSVYKRTYDGFMDRIKQNDASGIGITIQPKKAIWAYIGSLLLAELARAKTGGAA